MDLATDRSRNNFVFDSEIKQLCLKTMEGKLAGKEIEALFYRNFYEEIWN